MKRRKLGQHSLIDEKLLNEMVTVAKISDRDIVFEFGSGNGNLTKILCNRAKKVISYEIDEILYNKVKSRLKKIKNLKLIHGNALKSRQNFDKIVSNIPYSKSSEFIKWLIKKNFDIAVITVQKEFAEKLLSKQGSNDYKAITVIARSCFEINPLKEVSRDSFKPKPKVSSFILLLKPKLDKIDNATISCIKLLFSFRGKTVGAAIKTIYKKRGKNHNHNYLFEKFDSIMCQKRVEQLSIVESVKVAKELVNL